MKTNKSKVLTVRLTEKQYEYLQQRGNEKNWKVPKVIRHIISRAIISAKSKSKK